MSELTGLAVVFGIVVIATLIGVLLKSFNTRVRNLTDSDAIDFTELGIETPGERATIVQFSTVHCSRCPGVQRTLTELAEDRSDVTFTHIDVTDKPELARKFQLMQTPTVLIIGADAKPHTRLSGALNRATLTDAIDSATVLA